MRKSPLMKAQTSDTDGHVVKVEFYANGGLVGTDTVAPFSMVWRSGKGNTSGRSCR